MFNVRNRPEVPLDPHADPHNQIHSQLKDGEHRAALANLFARLGGFTEPWDDETGLFAKTHSWPEGPSSIMRSITGTLIAAGVWDEIPTPPPPSGAPTFQAVIDDCVSYGLTTTGTLGRVMPGSAIFETEGQFYSARYWQNNLTPETSAPFMMEHFGRYRLPESFAVSLEPQRLWTEYEKALALLALSSINSRPAAKAAAVAAFERWHQVTIPGPGTQDGADSTPGYVTINPRKVIYQAKRSADFLVLENVDSAAKACDGVAWLLGNAAAPSVSLYAAYSMQTYPIPESEWRAVLNLVGPGPISGPGFWIGTQSS